MAHSYVNLMVHYIFSTKHRQKIITPELEHRLWPYIGGIARTNEMKALAIGGIEDHIHLLISLPSTLSIAKAIQLIKGSSSGWVHDTYPDFNKFQWQEGYGAFSVGMSQIKRTINYINSQKTHHCKQTFKEEYISILKKHNVDYDERYIWG